MIIFTLALGILIGGFLGAIGTFLFIKETRIDYEFIPEDEEKPVVRESKKDIDIPDPCEDKDINEIIEEEIRYGGF
jgi:hypothetical protein